MNSLFWKNALFFTFFNFLFLLYVEVVFLLTYRETHFPGPIGKKKEWISWQFFTKTIW